MKFSTASPQTADDETLAETLLNIKRSTGKDKGKGTELPKKIKKREIIQLSLDEELAQKLHAEELAKETERQEREKSTIPLSPTRFHHPPSPLSPSPTTSITLSITPPPLRHLSSHHAYHRTPTAITIHTPRLPATPLYTPITTAPPSPPRPSQQQWLFQPLPPPWWAVGGGLATTAGLSIAKPPLWWRSDDGTATIAAPCGVEL
nr:hypothetical protein [Tanacetum cinerariifolium]